MDLRTRLKAEAHVLDRLLDLQRGAMDQGDAEAVSVSLDAFVHLGLIDRSRADAYRAALAASGTDQEAWPPPDIRDRAKRYVDSLFAALGDEPDAAALSHVSSALAALRDVGVISFEQWGEWLGRLFSSGADVEGVYAGLPSGGVFLMASEEDHEPGETLTSPANDFPILEARDLVRVVTGPFGLEGGPTLTSVELYADGLRLNWHGVREDAGQPPNVDDTARAEERLTAFETQRRCFWPYTVGSVRDDVGTEYRETGGSGGGWDVHRPRLILASSGFTPGVPCEATQLEIQIEGVGAMKVPLAPT
jgi:hypothetical protein